MTKKQIMVADFLNLPMDEPENWPMPIIGHLVEIWDREGSCKLLIEVSRYKTP